MHTLTERDIAYDMLYGTKSSGMTYMTATLEAAHPRCRETFHRLHEDAMRAQWSLWQFLHHKGEYRVDSAPYDEIEQVRRRMEHLCQTHGDQQRGQREAAYAGADSRSWNEQRGDARSRGWSDGRAQEGRWSTSGNGSGSGSYGGTSDGVRFEAGRNLPQGTRFEADRPLGASDPSYTGSSAYTGAGAGNAASGSYQSRSGGSGRGEGYRGDDIRGRSGARPADGSRNNFGENTWSATETRYSQTNPAPSYRS